MFGTATLMLVVSRQFLIETLEAFAEAYTKPIPCLTTLVYLPFPAHTYWVWDHTFTTLIG